MTQQNQKPNNMFTLGKILRIAQTGRFAVGAFSPRYVAMISPVLKAGVRANSPVIVQISQKELDRFSITPRQFSEEFFRLIEEEKVKIPVVLHLDHTKDFDVIKEAIECGFNSVMIDASEKSLTENIRLTKQVVQYAHKRKVSVEAELGRIGTTDYVETESDEELYTDPSEAKLFVEETGVDALAVSVGTAHGVYMVRQPKIEYERLQAIGHLTKVPLVLHGGSGVPAGMIHRAVLLDEGGICKVNFATDLELAFLKSIGREKSLSNTQCWALDDHLLEVGQKAVEQEVYLKIQQFLGSANKAPDYYLGGEEDGQKMFAI